MAMKGFFSAIIIILAFAALMAGLAFSMASLNSDQAKTTLLSVRAVSDRADDSESFFASTLDDAIIDSAYQVCGCTTSNASGFTASLLNRSRHYFNTSADVLSVNGITVQRPSPIISSGTPTNCNITTIVNASITMNVSGTRARATRTLTISRSFREVQGPSFITFNVTPIIGGGQPYYLTVSC
ncbi:MAG TPA: hypothetical protein VGQ00_02040 [Candidatus Norongarragalinales archaeon]|jgi:hypothetical protein|nr:hypothetical protein [Candidatus Norongarragalinales archaeon]